MTHTLIDQNISKITELIPPETIINMFPVNDQLRKFVTDSRKIIADIVNGRDQRILCIVGPCSIHDIDEAVYYAHQLRELSSRVAKNIYVVMRVYCEKPRTTIGWKGLSYDPLRDNSNNVELGLQLTRKVLIEINEIGLPCGCEFLDTILPQYSADLISWGAIGARTAESQLHRQLVSGLSMPVAFKNNTAGSVAVAICSIIASGHSHTFPGLTPQGTPALYTTTGNKDTHLMLRGSDNGPNYSEENVETAWQALSERCPGRSIMIDCSHGNSRKDYRNQKNVVSNIFSHSPRRFRGFMLESNIFEGRQDMDGPLLPGVSLTDGCISFKETYEILMAVNTILEDH